MTVGTRPSREYGKRVELQRMLGDRGIILERVAHGTLDRPAQGWYAMLDGEEVFLGDYFTLAAQRLMLMLT